MSGNGQSPTIRRVIEGQLCTGCGLCAGVAGGAIQMESVAPGYSRPHVLSALPTATEQKIATACPGTRVAPWPAAPHTHHHWGPHHRAMVGYALDAEVRYQASSGGALSALLIHALTSGQVERVLHIEADPDQPTRNRLRWSKDRDGVLAGAGSRYAASSPLEQIDAALADGRRFAFVGKPCDVAALRQLATVDPRVDQQVPLMLSFFCAGIPSHAGADRIIRRMGFEPAEVARFRYRGHGWPGMTRAETHDGRSAEMRYAQSWGEELSREVQFRCKICPDGVGGAADLACADAWYGGETGYPLFEEQDGRSLILTRTSAGEALLNGAVESGALHAEPVAVTEIALMQPGQTSRKRAVAARVAAARLLLQPVPDMRGLGVMTAGRTAPLKEIFRNFIGTLRRIVQNRR